MTEKDKKSFLLNIKPVIIELRKITNLFFCNKKCEECEAGSICVDISMLNQHIKQFEESLIQEESGKKND